MHAKYNVKFITCILNFFLYGEYWTKYNEDIVYD
jgi:hypothetical protein